MKSLLLFTLLFLLTTSSHAQLEQYSVPVVWERYGAAEHEVSVNFPKLPLMHEELDPCNKKETFSYFAYGEGAVYELTIARKLTKKGRQYDCDGPATPFSSKTLAERMNSLRETLGISETTALDGGMLLHKFFSAPESTRWVLSDLRDDRWIELAVHHDPNDKPNLDRFLKSLELVAGGKEIGRGAETNLGDLIPSKSKTEPAPASSPRPSISGSGNGPGDGSSKTHIQPMPTTSSLRIIHQPKARYTNEARQAEIQGATRLKITLHSNGGVGSVVPITTLSHGLTEQAIFVAKRIVFLPKRVNKVPVSVTVTREYTFSIY